MNKNRIAIVAPAHIPLTKDWINALEREARLGSADVIIVDDSDGKIGVLPDSFKVFGYDAQKEFLGELYEDFAKIFHKSSACRVFGHIYAYAQGYDIVIGLDSDCVVPTHFVEDHLTMLNLKCGHGWTNPLNSSEMYPRGFPYSMRNWKIVANMGMWDNVLDLNGADRFAGEPTRVNAPGSNVASAPIPFSGMNFAITREVLFGFLFLPNFNYQEEVATANPKIWQFRRIDDIWGGYIFQKLLQKLHLSATYGKPVVYHDTVVIAAEDAAEEEAMYKYEDEFIFAVEKSLNPMFPTEMTFDASAGNLMLEFIKQWKQEVYDAPFISLTPAFEWWAKVIQKYDKK